MEPIGSPETSVLNQLMPRNNPQDGRVQFNHNESLRSRIALITMDQCKSLSSWPAVDRNHSDYSDQSIRNYTWVFSCKMTGVSVCFLKRLEYS
jgi:hypothetical protein